MPSDKGNTSGNNKLAVRNVNDDLKINRNKVGSLLEIITLAILGKSATDI